MNEYVVKQFHEKFGVVGNNGFFVPPLFETEHGAIEFKNTLEGETAALRKQVAELQAELKQTNIDMLAQVGLYRAVLNENKRLHEESVHLHEQLESKLDTPKELEND